VANQPTDVFKHINMLTGPMCERLGTRCWPFTSALSSNGRPYFRLAGKNVLAYRLVYELVKGVKLERTDVFRHKCDNPICCNPEHGEIGTHVENMKDMRDRERHGLPHHTVRAIRKLAKDPNNTHEHIAKLYGLGRSTVTEIVQGKKYREVDDDQS
jgi:hypothetical protein